MRRTSSRMIKFPDTPFNDCDHGEKSLSPHLWRDYSTLTWSNPMPRATYVCSSSVLQWTRASLLGAICCYFQIRWIS
jgi:hypothetical protein